MPTREQVQSAFRVHGNYQVVGAHLGVPPGQAYLVATGLPADDGETYRDDVHRPGAVDISTQALVYHLSPTENPTVTAEVDAWIARKAGTDAQMCAAGAARGVLPGAPDEPREADICTVLTHAHDRVAALMKLMTTIPGAAGGGSPESLMRRRTIVDAVAVELTRHEVTEREHFWPAVRSMRSDGPELVARALSEEQGAKELLDRLGQVDAADEQFDRLVAELDTATRKHVAFEEVVLRDIRRDLSMEDRRSLGAAFREAEGQARFERTSPAPAGEKKTEKTEKTENGERTRRRRTDDPLP